MLEGVDRIENLRGLARSKARDYETKTVRFSLVEEFEKDGWVVSKKNKRSVSLKRPKTHGYLLEDRVWTLFYKMGFDYLSHDIGGKRGALLTINPKDEASPTSQIDVVGIDSEVAIAVECKSSKDYAKRPQFQNELGKHDLIRKSFAESVRKQFSQENKRQTILVMLTSNINLSENDIKRAREANIILFDGRDLGYYEDLVSHLGPAAKYQFFADMLPNKKVPGLSIRVPAVKTKMGGTVCYTFSILPKYLLKIAYVSHRAKGKASDVDAYQRMIKKDRLKKIREYIEKDGIFPTNIVVNISQKHLTFQRSKQEGENTGRESGVSGWLDIRPTYKSAWVIDGQHRLFAYSGLEKASKNVLSILAFEGLPPSKQAELFIQINAEQKSVKRSLLQELYAELHWNAEQPSIRARAIMSKAVQELDAHPESAFYGRIQTADAKRDFLRCISLTSIYSAIDKNNFHIAKEKKGEVIAYGPLWAGENSITLTRTVRVIQSWFDYVKKHAGDWWDKGSADGGGLAMNDGVTACINVLRSVFDHLKNNGHPDLVQLDDEHLCRLIEPYGEAFAKYLGSLDEGERKWFRDLRGAQGIVTRTRRCQQAIHEVLSNFNPDGLDEYMEREKAQTNSRAKEIIDKIERTLKQVVLEELQREFGEDESEWWIIGVPKQVRLKVTQKFEEDDGKRGGREYYFDLIHYKKIIVENWSLFEPLLAYGKGSKEKRTSWLDFLNEKRNVVAHSSSGVTLSLEELGQLQEYQTWLDAQINGVSERG